MRENRRFRYFARNHAKLESSLQRRQFPVDGCVRCALFLTFRHVSIEPIRPHLPSPKILKAWGQMLFPIAANIDQALSPVGFVFGQYAHSYRDPDHLRAAFETYRAFPANEKFFAAQREQIDLPIVIGSGEHDAFAEFLPRIAAAMRVQGCTNLTTETVKGAAHYVAEEKPEAVAELIERYAARTGSATRRGSEENGDSAAGARGG